ncbi:rhodanese-like domain-containing protein [Chroococcidiopsis sp. CCMEE 29]|uniref:rhodanese-like domain-containing protein n=1 Tax=Chroococcidiopsis sp. CCMEE 29 TaxID=155894 RepID=UPI002021A59A|nr:rhodanese-like domain-containing protein [Chroococcidiopsis sp. CCMEE 29]
MFLNWRSLAFRIIKSLISRKFPDVKWLTTKELAQWLADPVKQLQPIILDARSEAEYALSHLKNAERIAPDEPNVERVTRVPDTPIVVYCSVGYRSARIAQQLEQAGFSHVYNLEGSIFQWANEGRPVCQNDRPTTLVHPYNALWGMLLKPQSRAPVE